MATTMVGPYDVWLTQTLTGASSDIDTDVFVSYIIGILDDDTSEEDKNEGITELLSGVVESDVAATLCAKIVAKWNEVNSSSTAATEVDKGDQLSRILGQQTLATVKEKKLTKEELERKAAILAQYGHVSDGEEAEDEVEDSDCSSAQSTGGKSRGDQADTLLMKNVNKEEVATAERELREKSKQESEKKKEKDKQDRLAQKQKQTERKETEKKRTQKGEKRR